MRKAYTNCRIYSGSEIFNDHAIIVADNKVESIVPATEVPDDVETNDLNGNNISAAFIDLQIYGGNGKLFSHELSVESVQSTYEYSLAGGAAYFMLTMATNSIEKFVQGMKVANEYNRSGGKGLLGIHLEGPYLNPVKKGAHIEKYLHKPTLEEVQQLLEAGEGILKMMTLAPEQCDPQIVESLLSHNVLVSSGHTNATYQQGVQAFNNGIEVATHLFNAMSAFQSREPGMVGAIYDHQSVMSSVVCDGVHVDFAAVRISKQILGRRLFYITDAVAEVRGGEYEHVFQGDRYTLPDGTLSGSSLTMMKCVKNGVGKVGLALDESLRMANVYPASLLSNTRDIGSIKPGSEASFVIFNEALDIIQVTA